MGRQLEPHQYQLGADSTGPKSVKIIKEGLRSVVDFYKLIDDDV